MVVEMFMVAYCLRYILQIKQIKLGNTWREVMEERFGEKKWEREFKLQEELLNA